MTAGLAPPTGNFEFIDHYEGVGWFAKGWVLLPLGVTAGDLLLAIDGRGVQRFAADIVRPDLVAAGLENARAFEIRLPDSVKDGQPHDIAVVFFNGHQHLQQSPRRFTVPRFRGRVENVSGLMVEGWAIDEIAPNRPVVLDVEVDGALQQRVVADKVRYDLALALGTAGGHAFEIRLPTRFCDGHPHILVLRVTNTDQPLQGEPITINLSPEVLSSVMSALESDIAKLTSDLEERKEQLAKTPINELADATIYARWLVEHEARWPSALPAAFAGQRRPLFSLLPDAEIGQEALRPRLQKLEALAEIIGPAPASFADRVSKATGEYLIFPGRIGVPHEGALVVLANYLSDRQPACLYTDDDQVVKGQRCWPRFKPAWDADRFLGVDYIGRAILIRRDFALEVLAQGIPITGPHELIAAALLSASEGEIWRLPLVLFHAAEKPLPASAANRIASLKPWVARREPDLHLEPAPGGVLRAVRPLPSPLPEITLIIPTRDRLDLLRLCVESVLTRTDYDALRLLIVDNGSIEQETLAYLEALKLDARISVLRDDEPFNFSRLNNRAVSQIASPLICLLNNDIEVRDGGWLKEMVSHALRPEVGAVGAKLLFPSGLVQHGGVIVGFHGVAENSQRGLEGTESGYGYGLAVAQRATAVTAACLVCRREIYEGIGGLDETAFAVSFNDVDFCLRLGKEGHHILWTPYAALVHHESATRRVSDDQAAHERERKEADSMIERWETEVFDDAFYSPNLGLGGLSSHRAFRRSSAEN